MPSDSRLQHLTDDQLRQYHALVKSGMEKSARFEDRKEHNRDLKFLYHVVRLLDEVEQILAEGDLDLERNREQLKAIRRGEVGEREIADYFTTKEKALEELYNKSTLPYAPDEEAIKKLLLQCLEMHYGSLQGAYEHPDRPLQLLRDIQSLLDQHRDLLR